MLVAIVNDSHFGVRGDSPLYESIITSFFNDQFFPYLEKNKIKHVLHLGDLVDRRKYINIHTQNVLCDQFLARFNKDLKLTMILGNHDVYLRNTNSVNSIKPLVARNPHITLIERPAEYTFDGKASFLMSPWICDDNEADTLDMIQKSSSHVCFGHFELAGFELMPGIKMDHGHDKKILQKFSKVITGHYHHRSDDGHVYYLGTQYQLEWGDAGARRGFHVFDTESYELKFIENINQNFIKFNYDDETNDYTNFNFKTYKNKFIKVIVVKKTDEVMFKQFIQKMEDQGPLELTVIESEQTFATDDSAIDLSQDTFSIIQQYIESIEPEDKDKLVKVFAAVYNEALHPAE